MGKWIKCAIKRFNRLRISKDKMIEKKKDPPKPQPKYYSIELEALVPATFKYRILANSPEEAAELILKAHPIQQPKLIFAGMKRLSAKIFDYGTRIIKYSKKY